MFNERLWLWHVIRRGQRLSVEHERVLIEQIIAL